MDRGQWLGRCILNVRHLLRELESRGIIRESTGRARDRVYVYRRYLEALAAEEEPAHVRAAAKYPAGQGPCSG